jgi:hypothetical protein
MNTRHSAKRATYHGEVMRLRSQGIPTTVIADRLGISERTVRNWCNPAEYRRRLRRDPRLHINREHVPPTWETAKWADGPATCAWVLANIAPERITACGVRQLVLNWKDRAKVSVWAVDRVFVPLGLHISQVPEEMWLS